MYLTTAKVFIDGEQIIRFDRNEEYSDNAKDYAIELRASGVEIATIIKLSKAKGYQLTARQIYNTLDYFQTARNALFPKLGEQRIWEDYYKSRSARLWGRPTDNRLTYTTNQPIPVHKERKFAGITKAEEKLLKAIRGH